MSSPSGEQETPTSRRHGPRPRCRRSGTRWDASRPPPSRRAPAAAPPPSATRPDRPRPRASVDTASPSRPAGGDPVALRLLGRVHQLQPVDVLERPSSTMRASAPRSRTTSTFSGVRSARLATKADATAPAARRRRRARAAAARGAASARGVQLLGQRVLGGDSGSARADSPSCPSRRRRRRCRRRSRCTRTAGPCGCRCRSGRPARTACSRCSRPSPSAARSALRAREPRGSPRGGVVADDQRVAVEHRALEARVGAHVLADLLAQEAGVAVGGEAVEQHPEHFPRAHARSAGNAGPSSRIGVK